jgi:membrane dipeptidase
MMDVSAKARALHQSSLVVDAHSDYPVYMLLAQQRGNATVFATEHLPRLKSAGVRLETVTVGGDFQLAQLDLRSPFVTLAILDCVHEQLKACGENVILIQTATDLAALEGSERVGILFALEGTAPVTPDISLLRTYYRLGVRSLMLTHNERNCFADGCAEPPQGGLSKLGRELLQEINKLHMVLDLSHSNERTFYDALELYSGTPIASHSNARSLCDHPRNLTDQQIKEIAARAGVIGMNFLSRFVDSEPAKATPERVVDHIAYMANLIGIDHVGLGPDYADYYMDELTDWARKHSLPPMKYTAGLESVSQLPLLTDMLVKRGFSDSEIRQVLGDNFLRAYAANLAS